MQLVTELLTTIMTLKTTANGLVSLTGFTSCRMHEGCSHWTQLGGVFRS